MSSITQDQSLETRSYKNVVLYLPKFNFVVFTIVEHT